MEPFGTPCLPREVPSRPLSTKRIYYIEKRFEKLYVACQAVEEDTICNRLVLPIFHSAQKCRKWFKIFVPAIAWVFSTLLSSMFMGHGRHCSWADGSSIWKWWLKVWWDLLTKQCGDWIQLNWREWVGAFIFLYHFWSYEESDNLKHTTRAKTRYCRTRNVISRPVLDINLPILLGISIFCNRRSVARGICRWTPRLSDPSMISPTALGQRKRLVGLRHALAFAQLKLRQ